MSFLARLKQFFSPGDPIKHVVVLMFENHSFDQMLGCFPNVDGVDPASPRSNKDSSGLEYFQKPTFDPKVPTDPKHEVENVRIQLQDHNSGFVLNYEQVAKAKPGDWQKIMDYYPLGSLSALHTLAQHFTICNKWHSSVPGPTWTNGRVNMAESWHSNPLLYLGYDQDTIYDRLNEKGISWRIYHGDVPQSLVLVHQWQLRNRQCYKWFDDFAADVAGPEPTFPVYTFIEPRYYHIPTEPQNDDQAQGKPDGDV
jgi:phospholipase C